MALLKASLQKLFDIVLFFIHLFPKPDNLGDTSITDVVIKWNWIVVITVALIHIIYILIQFWTTNRDVIDHFMYMRAIDINDTPSGSYRYLITFYTNWRYGAGTNAKVFIQMSGVLGQNTICYYLHNPYLPYRKLFGSSDVSWFSLNTSIPIGEIKTLIIAHDNSGDHPAWYLTKVNIRDLQMNKSWRFFSSCWLTEDDGDYPKAKSKLILKPVDPDYVEPFSERMFEWARRIYRERPLTSWYNLNYITPLSRSQRLMITYVYLLTLMLLSIAYFASEVKKEWYLWMVGMTFRTGVSYIVLLTLNLIYSFKVFTTRRPTKTQYYIRTIFSILVYICCAVMTVLIIIYSTNKNFTGSASVNWLIQFIWGICQSELMIAVFVTFFKAFLFTLFARDPFEEETARIQLTRRVSTAKLFSHKQDARQTKGPN